MKTYSITTEERTYNSVNSKNHFQQVRDNWSDNSKVTRAFVWDNILGEWIAQKAPLHW